MPSTLQPVIVTPSMPLLVAFYKALLGAVEISRVSEDGPAFYVGLQIGNAELGVVADGDAHVDAPQRILLNVNVGDLGVGDVDGLLQHVETLGGRVLGPPNDMPWGQRVAHIQDPDGNTVNLPKRHQPGLPAGWPLSFPDHRIPPRREDPPSHHLHRAQQVTLRSIDHSFEEIISTSISIPVNVCGSALASTWRNATRLSPASHGRRAATSPPRRARSSHVRRRRTAARRSTKDCVLLCCFHHQVVIDGGAAT